MTEPDLPKVKQPNSVLPRVTKFGPFWANKPMNVVRYRTIELNRG